MGRDDFLTPADAARLLGVAPATVRQMARQGTLVVAAKTERGNRLFDRRAVEVLVRKREKAQRDSIRAAKEG